MRAHLEKEIFATADEKHFNRLALEIFHLQAERNPIYKNYLSLLKCKINSIQSPEQIPFLPIEFFKTHKIITSNSSENNIAQIFTSSGTTGAEPSKHYVQDVSLYEQSFQKCFELFYGPIAD